jgi:hypothetical protein
MSSLTALTLSSGREVVLAGKVLPEREAANGMGGHGSYWETAMVIAVAQTARGASNGSATARKEDTPIDM